MRTFLRSILDQYRGLSKPGRLFLAAVFMDGLLFSGFYLFLNLYILEAGYSRDFLGMVNAAPSIAALVLGVPMGLLSDRIGRKRAMIIGFTLANLAILGMVLVKTQALIIVLALAWGARGESAAGPARQAETRQSTDPKRGSPDRIMPVAGRSAEGSVG